MEQLVPTDFYQYVPRDMRPRTPRSELAQAAGKIIYAYLRSLYGAEEDVYLGTSLSHWEGNLPIFFGVQAGNRWLDNFAAFRGGVGYGYAYEFDPEKHGFIALCETPFHPELEAYMKFLLPASHEPRTIPTEAQAYRYAPSRVYSKGQGIFFRTILTETDGLVWFEHVDQGNQVSPSKLMIFPQTTLV